MKNIIIIIAFILPITLTISCRDSANVGTVSGQWIGPTNTVDFESLMLKLNSVKEDLAKMARENSLPGIDQSAIGKCNLRLFKVDNKMLSEESNWIPLSIKGSITNVDEIYVGYLEVTNRHLIYLISGKDSTRIISFCEATNDSMNAHFVVEDKK